MIPSERLLQFIWQFQYFNVQQLKTRQGWPVVILHPGNLNQHQGPDFLNAKIKINNTIWAGSVELHVNSTDWQAHGHSADKNYSNVILHVVWKQIGKEVAGFPTIELNDRISKLLLEQYEILMQSAKLIPCAGQIDSVPSLKMMAWKERLVSERLEQKAHIIKEQLLKNNWHWEEVFWWMIARNFGIKVNTDAFEQMAKSIPINILAKNKNNIHALEAMLFGQAGLLGPRFIEDYPQMLWKEYQYLKRKYSLTSQPMPIHFLRMRPANFPTIRLAQLAMLIHKSEHLFRTILETENLDTLKKLLSVTANDYWHYHYLFEEKTAYFPKKMGSQMQQNIIINTVIPFLFAYGMYTKNNAAGKKALAWLAQIPAEKNSITKAFTSLGLPHQHAADSQAYIQLNNEYCRQKMCLQCTIGNHILKEAAVFYQLL